MHEQRTPRPRLTCSRPVLACLVACSFGCAHLGRTDGPPIPPDRALVLCDAASLELVRARIAHGDRRAHRARDAALREAERAALKPVLPITSGKAGGAYTAPTKDPRDYVSLSPYWWPDPATSDGLPYVQRDGQINPDRAKYDANKLDHLGKSVQALAIAYFLTGEERFAERASEHLRAWFVTPTTRMNPNFQHAQFRPGRSSGMHGGMIESLRIRWLPDATALLESSASWLDSDQAKLRLWFEELLDWMLTSEHGEKERQAENNHGTWYAAQVVKIAVFVGREADARAQIQAIFPRIDAQISADGSQPHEMRRTRSLGYHDFNLRALLDIGRIARDLGIDVLGYEGPDGQGIRRAIDWALPRMTGELEWPGRQIVPQRRYNQFQMFRIAARLYDDPRYERAAEKLHPTEDQHAWMDILLPALH